jgi:hypothetical protein
LKEKNAETPSLQLLLVCSGTFFFMSLNSDGNIESDSETQELCADGLTFKLYCMLSAFHYCDKIPEKLYLKRGEIYFDSYIQSMVDWLHCSEPEGKQNTTAVGTSDGGLLTSWQPASKEGERARGHDSKCTFRTYTPVTYFFQLDSIP